MSDDYKTTSIDNVQKQCTLVNRIDSHSGKAKNSETTQHECRNWIIR